MFRPKSVAQGFALGKEYSLENLVVINGVATPTQLCNITTEVLTGVGLSYRSENLTLGAKYDVAFGGNQH